MAQTVPRHASKGKEKNNKTGSERKATNLEKISREKADSEKVSREKPNSEKASREKADSEKVSREKSNREKTSREKTNREKTSREKINREKASREKANREKANREKPNSGKHNQQSPVREKNNKVRFVQKNPEKSDNRKFCPVAKKCGGCQWIDRDYQEQLTAKATTFRKLMEPYCKPEPMIAMEDPVHYRNKVHAVFGEDGKHNIISGIYEEKSHRIVPVDSCLIENRKADEIIVSIRELLRSFKIRPYNEDTGYGLLRHVLVRTGHATGQIMVVLVLSSPIMPSKNNFVKALRKLHPEITTVVVNVNDRNTSMVLGTKEQVIYGKGYIEDELCGKRFRISPRSFYQVNPIQTEKLYGKAMEYARLTGKETVLDAYCGTGTIGMIASDYAGKVLGVELNADAVRDARFNAKSNDISNIEFYQNDAGRFMLDMAEQGRKLDVLFMDPPRSGSDEAFLNAVCRIKPEKVVYISCNPETLVRDLKYLTKHGYAVEKAVPVDMFPFTDNMETVCLLNIRNEKR